MGYFSLGNEEEGEVLPGLIGFYPISVHIIGIENIDTTEVTNMQHMFAGVNNKELDLTNFNTKKATNMSYMFSDSINLTTITYSENFIYVEGVNVEFMFNNCPANKPTDESWSGIL